MQTLTRKQLTAALAARQMLIDRRRLAPAEAIRALTPLQGQDSPAPHVALAARLDGFSQDALHAALSAGSVVKTTIMRTTLHLAAGEDYPAYAQLTRQSRMRSWRRTYPHLDEEEVAAELGAWLAEPRTNAEIRERVRGYEGVPDDVWSWVDLRPHALAARAASAGRLLARPQTAALSCSIRALCPTRPRPPRSS